MNRIIRTDGTTEPIPFPPTIGYISDALGGVILGTVNLHHLGIPLQVMFVDDYGDEKKLPINAEATALYRANCRKGTDAAIRGDVAIVYDHDFSEDE